jgi:hypothetical protein
MRPTVFRAQGLRFFLFSREEPRLHIHVQGEGGEARFLLEPVIELAGNWGLSDSKLMSSIRLIRDHEDEIRSAWESHFGG